jgi:hypothetical protein
MAIFIFVPAFGMGCTLIRRDAFTKMIWNWDKLACRSEQAVAHRAREGKKCGWPPLWADLWVRLAPQFPKRQQCHAFLA